MRGLSRACSTPKAPPSATRIYPEYKAHARAHAGRPARQIEPIHEVGAAAGLAGAGRARRRGRRRDRHPGAWPPPARAWRWSSAAATKTWRSWSTQRITIIDTMNGKRRDVAGWQAEFGVPPDLMIDYQTLVGDAVDNVPGVAQGGPQDRRQVAAGIRLAGGVMAARRRDQGRGRREPAQGAGLAAHRPPAAHHQDRLRPASGMVPGLPSMDALALVRADRRSALRTFYERYGFQGPGHVPGDAGGLRQPPAARRPTSRRADATPGPVRRRPRHRARAATRQRTPATTPSSTWDALRRTGCRSCKPRELVALDTETDFAGRDAGRRSSASASASTPGEAAYIPLAHDYPGAPRATAP